MLNLIILIPALVALVAYTLRPAHARWLAIVAALADLGLAVNAFSGEVLTYEARWIPALGINYSLHLDGLAILMVMLAPMLTVLALLVSSTRLPRLNEYSALLLLLLAALQGVFLADNLGLFYIFWDVMILPAFLLVGRWGGEAGRKAAIKFFLYTLAGSLAMLVAIVMLGFAGNTPDFSFGALAGLGLSPSVQLAMLVFFFLGFAVKVPLVPFHGWQADVYESCPAPVAAVIAGVMSKAGVYGFLKVCMTLFPEGMARAAPYLGTLALVTLLYGAACALGQERTRRVLAYGSLSHMGMIMLGVFSLSQPGVEGAVLQMFCHGVTTAGLLLLVGFLEARDLPSELDRLGGLAGPMPGFGLLLLLFCLANLGLPGLCSFPAELSMLAGIFPVNPVWAVMATLGLVMAAWYMLRFFQRIANGTLKFEAVPDLRSQEAATLLPLAALILWIGVRPLEWMLLAGPAVTRLLVGGP